MINEGDTHGKNRSHRHLTFLRLNRASIGRLQGGHRFGKNEERLLEEAMVFTNDKGVLQPLSTKKF